MARGKFFEMNENLFNLGALDPDALPANEGSWFEELKGGAREESLEALFKLFKAVGFEVGVVEHMDEMIPYVVFNENGKMKWFSENYDNFKKMAAETDLHAFATRSTAELRFTICDEWADAVYMDDELHYMDEFIRTADVGEKYYFGNVVLAH